MECIFCSIIAGEIPCIKVCEDEATLVFMDVNPVCEGHLLVIPKKHFPNLFSAEDEDLATVMAAVRRVAVGMRSALGIDSMNLVQANGLWAVQSVPHFHIHLIPRREDDGIGLDWPLNEGNIPEITKMAENIATVLS